MTASHAENHDRDKLGRWHKDLVSGKPGNFPAYAVFLVSREDRCRSRRLSCVSLKLRGPRRRFRTLGDLRPARCLLCPPGPVVPVRVGRRGSPDAGPVSPVPQAEAVHTVALSPGEPDEQTGALR